MHSTTLFTGEKRMHFTSVDSTNTRLGQILKENELLEGASLTADFQSLGRGQQGAVWHSDSGMNLLVSYLLFPVMLNAQEGYALNLLASLAVSEAVATLIHHEVHIKWPNDIFVADRKLAGLLIETVLQGDLVRQAIVGIGLNVNQKEFPAELQDPVSLSLLSGKNHSIDNVFEILSLEMERWYHELKKSGIGPLIEKYENRLYRKGSRATYQDERGVFEGEITGIDKNGRLMLIDSDGIEKRYDVRTLRYLR
ncbi:MAG: biotin--[acetyl-CoA-carboxylase] ligase [Bacteroidota bacterium]